jgi:hypothetical protein
MKQFISFLRKSDGPTSETMTFLQRWIMKFYQTKPSLATGGKIWIFYYNIK